MYPQNLHVRHGDQPLVHHVFDHWQEALNVLLGIDDLDHDRQIVRQQVRPVNLGSVAESFEAAENRRAGNLQFQTPVDDGFVQRFAAVLIPLRKCKRSNLAGR